ncbi:MAG: DUF6379 domain-containing protein [Lachnospiraceae bacterium]|jgi:hypothetical protein|nr:DUF6379 domain-containing protein [Lachnospiraceae bacterium]
MAGRQIYNPNGFKNEEKDGKIIGFSFEFKLQYYRGITPSIIRDFKINVDGIDYEREKILFSVNGETFTMEEIRTLVDSDYRWEFGEFAKITVLNDAGLSKGKHHIKAIQIYAPSYMPFIQEVPCETDFEIN